MEKVGIIGGAGYVGQWIAKRLAADYSIVIIDLREPNSTFGGEFRRCDIRSFEDLKESLNDVDIVINTAIVQIPTINVERRLSYEVNILGAQNACKVADSNPRIRGLVQAGSWHVIGEAGITGTVDETFGYRPDKVEERARLYVLSKIAQEVIVRYYDEMSDKVYSVIRLGTVIGEGMPKDTAANIFINQALKGEPLTPFKHSMYRPMLFVDVEDVSEAFHKLVTKILNGEVGKDGGSLNRVVNFFYPEPVTVLELAELVKSIVAELTGGALNPDIRIVDKGYPPLFNPDSKRLFRVDTSKARELLGSELTPPRENLRRIIAEKLRLQGSVKSVT